MTYVRFSESVETYQPNEEEMSEEILALMLGLARSVSDRRRHAVRAVHAKSHGRSGPAASSCAGTVRKGRKLPCDCSAFDRAR